MPTLSKPTNELKDTVRRVLKKDHPSLEGLQVEAVFTDAAQDGIEGMGKLHVIKGVGAYLYYSGREDELGMGDTLLVVEVSKPWWQAPGMEKEQKDALIDHILSYIEREEGTGKLIKCKPDVQEFNAVVARRGEWHGSVKDFIYSATQGKLPFDTGEVEEEAPAENAKATGEERPSRTRRRRGAEAEAS